jgi:outer membrane protein TolC
MKMPSSSAPMAWALVALFSAVPAAFGQAPANPDSALLAMLAELKGAPLSLEAAVQQALQNATSIRRAEADYLAARGAVRRERGAFDPEFFFSLDHQSQDQPTASFFAGASVLATRQTTSRTGLRLGLPVGTQLELSLHGTRLGTNSQFAFLDPEYSAFGRFSVRQPLLNGFSRSARKGLAHAEQTLAAEKARYDQQVLDLSAEVERRYWDLYAAGRDYAVQRFLRDRAASFLEETRLRVQAGLVGPNQVANARTFLAEQELLLIDREEQFDRQSDQLAALIGVRPEAPRFLPVDAPPGDLAGEPVEALIDRALKHNLDLQAAQRDLEAAQVLAEAARAEARPRADLVGSLGGGGLSGTAQEVVFGSDTLRTGRSGGLGEALTQTVQRDYPTWSVGVELSVPIGLRRASGERERLEAQVLGARQAHLAISRRLEEQVRGAWRELSHGKNRLEVASEGVAAAQEQLRIGMVEFHNGRSTAFELVRLGADLAVAQRRYSEALVRTAKAAATLKQLTH